MHISRKTTGSPVRFIDRILNQSKLSVITRLRCDANCKYLYNGPVSKGRGAPKKYDGKIDWSKPDFTHLKLCYQDETIMVYDAAIVYCMFLKRKIRIAFCQFLTHDFRVSSFKIYACTDLLLPALLIQQYYKARFQQEFLTARAAPPRCQAIYRTAGLPSSLGQ
jgi:hypothetical protein